MAGTVAEIVGDVRNIGLGEEASNGSKALPVDHLLVNNTDVFRFFFYERYAVRFEPEAPTAACDRSAQGDFGTRLPFADAHSSF